jgi:hypothetical protein
MMYNTQNYWVFGLCLLSGILQTRKHNILETESVSVLRWGVGEDTYSVHLVIISAPNQHLLQELYNTCQKPTKVMRQINMIMGPVGLRTKNGCGGKGQQ